MNQNIIRKIKYLLRRQPWSPIIVNAYRKHFVLKKILKRIETSEKSMLPRGLSIESTNRCNLACVKCPRNCMKRPVGFMDIALLKHITDSLSSSEGFKQGERVGIMFTGAGDPLLHPSIAEMVDMCKKCPAVSSVAIATNAVALYPKLAKELLSAGIDSFKISLDAVDPDIYEKRTGRKSLSVVENNLYALAEMLKDIARPVYVNIRPTLAKENEESIAKLIEKWSAIFPVLVRREMSWACQLKEGAENELAVMSNKFLKLPCLMLWESMYVSYTGEVALCCVDTMDINFSLGNVTDREIESIWKENMERRRFQEMHKTMRMNELPLCGTCDLAMMEEYRYDRTGNKR